MSDISAAVAYASISYASQTTSLSFSSQQKPASENPSAPVGAPNDASIFSLNYTSTTTVATISLLYVQESANSNQPQNDNSGNAPTGQSALETVLAGPGDPFNPLNAATPVTNTALDILKGTFDALQSGDDDEDDDANGIGVGDDGDDDDGDDDEHSNNGIGNQFGHAVRDNTYGHTKDDIQAAYSVTQLQVTTTSVEFSLTV